MFGRLQCLLPMGHIPEYCFAQAVMPGQTCKEGR